MHIITNDSQLWFTADTHFGHKNIIRYCNRPFDSVEQMDQTIIDNLNANVKENDWLFHLGDFSFSRGADRGRTNNAQYYLDKLRCKNVVLILGNHDPHDDWGQPRREFAQLFRGCYTYVYRKVLHRGKQRELACFHYGCRIWNKAHYGSYHLYGHSHGTLTDLENSLSIDVGVDAQNFQPLSLDDIDQLMSKKSFRPIDHHRANRIE